MSAKAVSTLANIVAAVAALAIGMAAGYYVRTGATASPPPSQSAQRAGSGMMGGRGGGGGEQPQNGPQLARLVRNLDAIQQAQKQAITPQEAQALVPVLKSLKAAKELPDKDAEARQADIEQTLTQDQKDLIASLRPRRGGGGGGRGGPGGPGMGGSGGGPGGGAPQPDPNKPLAGEAEQKALNDLLAQSGK